MTAERTEKRGWLARWRAPKKQERQIATLQEGFNELVGLTRSIREHMEQQALTQTTLVSMLEHMPGAVEGLKGVGEATKQQTETLQLLRQQLESAARNEGLMMDSMDNFNKTLKLMDDMSSQTSQTVTTMADRTRDSEDMLRNLLERSERRLIAMIVTLMIVTLGVLGVGLYIGLGQRADDPTPPPPVPVETPADIEEEDESAAFQRDKDITDLSDGTEAEEMLVIPEALPAEDDEPAEEQEGELEEELDATDDELVEEVVIDEDIAEDIESQLEEQLEEAELDVEGVEVVPDEDAEESETPDSDEKEQEPALDEETTDDDESEDEDADVEEE